MSQTRWLTEGWRFCSFLAKPGRSLSHHYCWEPGLWSLASPGSHSHSLGLLPPSKMLRELNGGHTVWWVCQPQPFASLGEIFLLPLATFKFSLLPHPQDDSFRGPVLLEKQAWESNCLKAISAFRDHKLLWSKEVNTKAWLSAWKRERKNTGREKRINLKKLSHAFGLGTWGEEGSVCLILEMYGGLENRSRDAANYDWF